MEAWASAHIALSIADVVVRPNVLDEVIQWARKDPRFIEKQEPGMAQKQWTIQLRFDPLGENDKKEYLNTLVIRVASHLLAQAQLLEGPVSSTIAVYSDDFMKQREQIKLVPDTIGAALRAYAATEDQGAQEGLSAEMQGVIDGLANKKQRT